MPRDLRTPLREAIVQHGRQNDPLTQLVPALSIHGERVPANQQRPFISLSKFDVEAFNAQCIRGGRIEVRFNVFADGEDSSVINAISAALVEAFDDAQLDLDGGWCLDFTYVRTTPVPTGTENTRWQDQVTFVALTGVGD